MPPLNLPGDCWPTGPQISLLRAAFLSGEPARQAWQLWREHYVRLDALDLGSQRLLPLVWKNLRAQQVSDPLLAPIKLRYRDTWFRNQVIFGQLADVLELLHAAGLPTLILKGAALSLLYYRDPGLRPMGDFDILVPADQILPTFHELERRGWRALPGQGDPRQLVAVRHAVNYGSPDGSRFDLHWHVLFDGCYPEADASFWAGAVPVQIHQASALALNPTDQLFHVCVHGASFDPVPPVRWAADAMQILRTPGAGMDWPRLLDSAARLRESLPLRDTLVFLKSVLEAPIPPGVIEALAAIPVTRDDRDYYRLKVASRRLLGDVPVLWQHYRFTAAATHQPVTWSGFAQYLRQVWGLTAVRRIPGFLLWKAVRRVSAMRRQSGAPAAGPAQVPKETA